MSVQNRLVPITEVKVDGEQVLEVPIVEVNGVQHAAACPDCDAPNRPLVFVNGAPHAACSCDPEAA